MRFSSNVRRSWCVLRWVLAVPLVVAICLNLPFAGAVALAKVPISFACQNPKRLAYVELESGRLILHELKNEKRISSRVPKARVATSAVFASTGESIRATPSLTYLKRTPYIVYRGRKDSTLMVAYRGKSGWNIQQVDPNTKIGNAPSISQCGRELCISYQDSVNRDLLFARGQKDGWKLSVIEQGNQDLGALSAISATRDGRSVVVYSSSNYPELRLAREDASGKWEIEKVPAITNGTSPALAVGDNETIHIVSTSPRPNNIDYDLSVNYARRDSDGLWSQATVSNNYAGGQTSLSLTKNNLPLVAYRLSRKSPTLGDMTTVEFAELLPSGVWETTQLSSPARPIDGLGKTCVSRAAKDVTEVLYAFSVKKPSREKEKMLGVSVTRLEKKDSKVIPTRELELI